jgi:hypothetical protein
MAILGGRRHTAGDTRRWVVRYGKWLDNTATILSAVVTSPSPTCTIGEITVLGREVVFFTVDGVSGENFNVLIQITDSLDNVKSDTIAFTVVPP